MPRNSLAVTHGGRRAIKEPAALSAIAAKRAEVIKHLGGDPSLVQLDLATDYCRLDVLIESVVENIETGGIFTAKGASRAATGMLLLLTDRRLRLAQVLGIERRAKPIQTVSEILREQKAER